MRTSERMMMAAFSGMVAGLVIGLLFAPEKGSVTRRKLMDKAADLSDRIKSTAEDALEKLNQLRSSLKSESEGMEYEE